MLVVKGMVMKPLPIMMMILPLQLPSIPKIKSKIRRKQEENKGIKIRRQKRRNKK